MTADGSDLDPVTVDFLDHLRRSLTDDGTVLDASPDPQVRDRLAAAGLAVEHRPLDEASQRGGFDAIVCVGGFVDRTADSRRAALAELRRRVGTPAPAYVVVDAGTAAAGFVAELAAAGFDVVEQREQAGTVHLFCRTRPADPKPREGASLRALLVGLVVAVAVGFGILLVAGSFGTAGVVGAALLEAVAIFLLWRWSPSS